MHFLCLCLRDKVLLHSPGCVWLAGNHWRSAWFGLWGAETEGRCPLLPSAMLSFYKKIHAYLFVEGSWKLGFWRMLSP